jgi:uracil-DNA glycosylase family 4
MEDSLEAINKEIINCRKCPRLISYIQEVAKKKKRAYRNWEYWGKPVPSFGDPNAKILIIGLAPAAHGANRTGRMFTGDASGKWLYKALYEVGLSNKEESISKDDDLKLNHVYITATIHCAPPKNKPNRDEIENCSYFLKREIDILKNVKVYVLLGRIAFDNFKRLTKLKGEFANGKILKYKDKWVICSYHPSAQNTLTGRLKWDDWIKIFKTAKELAFSEEN